MKLNVLMFGWEFPPHNSGGLGTACLGICQALAKRKDVKTVFVLPKTMTDLDPQISFDFAGLEDMITLDSLLYPYITSLDYESLYLNQKEPSIYGPTLLSEVEEYAKRAESIALKHNYDIIHSHDWLSFPAGLRVREMTGKPLVVHVHATEFDRTGGHGINKDVYEIEREGMRQADGIIAISNWTKNILLKHYDVPESKIKVIHNGINMGDFETVPQTLKNLKRGGNKIVLFVGRITLQKGPDYFIEAAKRVLSFRPNVYFVIAGSGDMERAMIRKVAKLGLSDRVIFTGFLRGRELKQMYQSADLFVLPSVSEPFGLTPLESLISGTPVIISKQSGVAEVLSHALKVDFWDIEEMANKIIALIDNPALGAELKTGGRKEARAMTWDKAVTSYVDYYREILNNLARA